MLIGLFALAFIYIPTVIWAAEIDRPAHWYGDHWVQGLVVDLPEDSDRRQRFLLLADQLDGEEVSPTRLRIDWYEASEVIQPGERWRLRLRLHAARGFANPGGFDYPKWLSQQGIVAVGYVREPTTAQRLAPSATNLDALRAAISARILSLAPGREAYALLAGLAVGDRRAVSDAQWRLLSATGTTHLMAISGLHIGLVAGALYILSAWLWRHCRYCVERLPAPWPAALLAWSGGLVYAALAGFGVPTQRALWMFALALLPPLLGRPLAPFWGLCSAGLVIVLLDPSVLTAPGFWLSFAAVGLILLGFSGRRGDAGLWARFAHIHWLLAVGLLPLLGLFFNLLPLASPLANLLAVPFMALLVVPLTLIGTLILYLLPEVGGWLLARTADLLDLLWLWLQLCAAWLPPYVVATPDPIRLSLALLAVVWWFGPWGWRLKLLAPLLLLPLLSYQPQRPKEGAVAVTLLDVGQALAVVVRTRGHTLVYDTGAAYGAGFDAGSGVIAPYLRRLGIGRVDTLIVSHAGADHSGGVPGLSRSLTVGRRLTGMPEAPRLSGFAPCRAGEVWQWEGVVFRLLYPGDEELGLADNDRSCVLQVLDGAGRGLLLLTGDLEQEGERRLLQRWGEGLQSRWLQVPHHGSRTSSHPAFVAQVRPEVGLISSGYGNRYHLPRPEVVARYAERGVWLFDTARDGAVTLSYDPATGASEPRRWRSVAQDDHTGEGR